MSSSGGGVSHMSPTPPPGRSRYRAARAKSPSPWCSTAHASASPAVQSSRLKALTTRPGRTSSTRYPSGWLSSSTSRSTTLSASIRASRPERGHRVKIRCAAAPGERHDAPPPGEGRASSQGHLWPSSSPLLTPAARCARGGRAPSAIAVHFPFYSCRVRTASGRPVDHAAHAAHPKITPRARATAGYGGIRSPGQPRGALYGECHSQALPTLLRPGPARSHRSARPLAQRARAGRTPRRHPPATGPSGCATSLTGACGGEQDGAPLPGGERGAAAWGCYHVCSSTPASGRTASGCGGHVVLAETLCRLGTSYPRSNRFASP